jgi:cytochrome c biogenesis protein CcmG/thiol:disulfide interchange protein DsbE
MFFVLSTSIAWWFWPTALPTVPVEIAVEDGRASVAMPVPQVRFETLDGKVFDLSQFKGRPIILNFWASWCPPCVAEFPSLVKLVTQAKGKFVLVAVSNDKDPKDVEKFLQKFPQLRSTLDQSSDIHIVIDRDGKSAATNFAVMRLPETFVINKGYLITRKFVGLVDWFSPQLVAYFDAVANQN